MEKFVKHFGSGVPLRRSNVDTDQIIPAVYLKRVTRSGFEDGLFSAWRNDPEFVLNQEAYKKGTILVAGPEFGTGSSREHAVWAILQGGFNAVIAPSFSDIFRNNCTKNGLVPVVLSESTVNRIWDVLESDPTAEITIDIQRLTVEIPSAGITEKFDMDASMQDRFIRGLDDVGITMTKGDAISSFESSRPAWLNQR